MVSLDEEKSKKLGELLSNTTARKILEYLSDHEGTAKEISLTLKLPLNTVTYNLKNLQNQDLIEAKEFMWSPKGREQDIYKVKKKYIVILPGGKDSSLREILKTILPVAGIGILLATFIEWTTKSTSTPLAQRIATESFETVPSLAASTPEVVQASSYFGLFFFLGVLFALLFLIIILGRKKK